MSKVPSLRLWSMLAILAAVVGWILAPAPESPTSLVQSRRDDWNLAALPRRFDQSSLAAVIFSASYWGSPAANASVAAAPPQDPRWRIAAVYGKDKEGGVLVVFEMQDKPPQRLQVGDVLPSGHRIESIGERDVCVRVGKKTYRLGVERREQ